jgi:ribokinase
MKRRVGVLGDIVMDLILEIDNLPITTKTYRLREYHFLPGGSAANYAAALARLNIPVLFIGKIGCDIFGKNLLDEFKKDGVIVDYMVIDESIKTGLATVLIDKRKKRASISFWKTYASLKFEELDLSFLDQITILTVSGYNFIEKPLRETTEKVLKLAKKEGIMVILDPCPYLPNSGLKALKRVLKYVNVITPNEDELFMLTGLKNVKNGLLELNKAGPEIIAVKLGRRGCIIFYEDKVNFIPSFKVKTRDPGGAGDAFCAGLTMGLLNGLSPIESAVIANAMGAFAVTKIGSRTALPTLLELKDFLVKRKNMFKVQEVLLKMGW